MQRLTSGSLCRCLLLDAPLSVSAPVAVQPRRRPRVTSGLKPKVLLLGGVRAAAARPRRGQLALRVALAATVRPGGRGRVRSRILRQQKAQKAALYEVALGLCSVAVLLVLCLTCAVHALGGRSGAASVCVCGQGLSEWCLTSSKLSHSSSRLCGSFSLTRFLLFGALLGWWVTAAARTGRCGSRGGSAGSRPL